MKVLFISGGKKGKAGAVVTNQGESLEKTAAEITYLVIAPGFLSYVRSVRKIRQVYRRGRFDIVHAHYGLSGMAAALASCTPLVVSLMGSDVYYSRIIRFLVRIFSRFFWDMTIVKSGQMKDISGIRDAVILPNGVDLSRFVPIEKHVAREKLGITPDSGIILFISAPGRSEKNRKLAEKAVEYLDDSTELKCIHNVPNNEIPYWLNSSDLLLVTSKWEGSVNVIKEAMACNCPVVSTDAGDASWLLGDLQGHYISGYDEKELAGKIREALGFAAIKGKTHGRDRIMELDLDSHAVAGRLMEIYNQVAEGK